MNFKKPYPSFCKFNGIISLLFLVLISCSQDSSKKEVALFETQYARCHIAPSIDQLTKKLWVTKILPEMGARMGIKDSSYNPMKGLSFDEMKAIYQTGIYPLKPTISKKDWQLLKAYIISKAPDSLMTSGNSNRSNELVQFLPKPISLDSVKGTFITYLEYNKERRKLFVGDISGNLFQFDFDINKSKLLGQFGSAVVAYTKRADQDYVTAIGQLNPSEIPSGRIFTVQDSIVKPLQEILHRPVNTLVVDLFKNGKDELVISEFGNLTGKLSLLTKADSLNYQKTTLLNQPGTIRVMAKDMDQDGKDDLVALTSQGDESISILYQEDNQKFRSEKVIRFSPIYGTSWFEIIDYDGDGDFDIVTANGDNADKTYIPKPYHGLRIHINDGNNNFVEKYFYPMNGATRLLARDFDQDGDIDFGILSTFPDYDNNPNFTFVYLENSNTAEFGFIPYTFEDSNLGRWFLMDAGDVDEDGDEDIILSSFTYVFTPVPDELLKLWEEKNIDIMVLENKLINKN